MFNIKPNDNLIVLGDENSGIALLKEDDFMVMMNMILNSKAGDA